MFFCNLTADWLFSKENCINYSLKIRNEKWKIDNYQPCPLVFYLIYSDQWSVGFFILKSVKFLPFHLLSCNSFSARKRWLSYLFLMRPRYQGYPCELNMPLFLNRGPRATYNYVYKWSKKFRLVFLANLHTGLNWD